MNHIKHYNRWADPPHSGSRKAYPVNNLSTLNLFVSLPHRQTDLLPDVPPALSSKATVTDAPMELMEDQALLTSPVEADIIDPEWVDTTNDEMKEDK